MTPAFKRWDIAPVLPRRQRDRMSHLHPLLAQILFNRGITDPEEADAFLTGRVRFTDPFRMKGIRAAVERIRAAIRAREPIVVYGDFDADGVTATALLVQTLCALGADVRPYIPHRVDEGYGLHCDALDRLAAEGARLVITVDCGIRSAPEVAHGNALGLDMIVTDHHSIQRDAHGRDLLPPALAVINPKQQGETYPFADFAGVGLAFKLAQALLLAERQEPLLSRPPDLQERDLLDLVALGTVADLAPLLGENRSLVQRGLAELNKPRRPGIQAMLEEARLAPGKVDATAIGFVLGPRINAAGRLDSAGLSYDLLTAADALTAQRLAGRLGELNRDRQDRTQQLVDLAKERIGQGGGDRYLYLVADRGFHPGIVGLVAGRLAEELYRPALVAEITDDETHGSARSIPEFNITAALDACCDLLIRHGGHAAAAGFAVRNENLPTLQARLEAIAEEELSGQDLAPSLAIDAEVSLAEFDFALVKQLALLEPCGYANPQPVFASLGLEVVSARPVGAEGKHLKLQVRAPRSPAIWDAIAFRMGEWFADLPRRVDLAYAIEINEFNGRSTLQLNVKDIRPA
ncbi:MAG: single-stranded-DNA-specific exonuclease RecJ [Anaerolineae bacterium]|nr:single-stranded-DNA-specific exonuclease RecJ [Anaerolineae bacterium]